MKFLLLPIVLSYLVQLVSAFSVPNGECSLDIASFTGGWFELATSWNVANTIERGCSCPVAYYSLNVTNPENLDVTNSCIRYGQFWKLSGIAFPVEGGSKGNLNVQFFGGRTVPAENGNYIVLKTWEDEYGDYTHALVGSNNEQNWWILGRSPSYDEEIVASALHLLQSYEYNVTNYRVAEQDCTFLGGHDGVNLHKNNA